VVRWPCQSASKSLSLRSPIFEVKFGYTWVGIGEMKCREISVHVAVGVKTRNIVNTSVAQNREES
jgi:hypothetical protein